MRKMLCVLSLIMTMFLLINIDVHAAEEKNSQINFIIDAPEGFDLDLYALIINMDTFEDEVVPILHINDYKARVSVKAGTYNVVEIRVIDDLISKYAVIGGQQFTLTENSVYTVETTFFNYEEIEKMINEGNIEKKEEPIEIITEIVEEPDNVIFPNEKPLSETIEIMEELKENTNEIIEQEEEIIENEEVKQKSNFFVEFIERNVATLIIMLIIGAVLAVYYFKNKE